MSETDLVAGDAAVADFACAFAHEPGNGSFDYWVVLPVWDLELIGEGVGACCAEEIVVWVDLQFAAAT